MASFKYLIFIALAVYAVTAQEVRPAEEVQATKEGAKVKRQAFYAAVSAPTLAYSAPAAYPYAYSAYPTYQYSYPASVVHQKSYVASYPAAYLQDDGSYYTGKYDFHY